MAKAVDFFNETQKTQIVEAIKIAELNTSGEVRVHIESVCKGDVLDRASQVFAKLEMHKTELRNGVLIYLAIETRSFAIIGDSGINSVVPAGFWDSTKDLMISYFKTGDYATGLIQGILKAGEQLKAHFAYQDNDVNELPDEISFGK
jgi:uncharacterized membrane protein